MKDTQKKNSRKTEWKWVCMVIYIIVGGLEGLLSPTIRGLERASASSGLRNNGLNGLVMKAWMVLPAMPALTI